MLAGSIAQSPCRASCPADCRESTHGHASHRHPPSPLSAGLHRKDRRRAQAHHPCLLRTAEELEAEPGHRGDGQGRHRGVGAVGFDAQRVARRRRLVADIRPRGQRGRREDAARLQGPLRPFRGAGAARRRRQPARDRIRLRQARRRRHRADDELHGQVSRRRSLRAGVRRAQPAQGRGLFPPDRGELRLQRHPEHPAADDRIPVRHHPRDRQPAVRRHVPPLPQHQMDLLAWRRRARHDRQPARRASPRTAPS